MDAHAEPTPEELVPLQPAPEPDAPTEAETPADAGSHPLGEWLAELADRREELRLYRAREEAHVAADRMKARRIREQADRIRQDARAERRKARSLYGKFLKRMKRKWSAERRAAEAERAELERVRRQLAEEVGGFEAEQARFSADAAAYKKRMEDAWELLTDGQRRLLADRQESERTLAAQQAALDRRAAELAEQGRTLEASRARTEGHVEALRAEVARLEARAVNARAAVQSLEEKRANLEAGVGPMDPVTGIVLPASAVFHDRVALTPPSGNVEDLLAGLAVRESDLSRDQRTLEAARAEFERRAADLIDRRAVLAEQVAALVVARQTWQTAECHTLAELENLAHELNAREGAIELREHELDRAAQMVRRREEELWNLRAQLEGWQAALAAHEVSAAAARDRAEAELTARREHLTKWESALGTLCRKWADARRRDRETLREELGHWAESRDRYLAGLAELDARQDQLAADAARVAGASAAVEEAEQALTGGPRGRLARRKLRVLRRKWESHFKHFLGGLDERRAALATESAEASERYRELTRQLADVAERRAEITEAEQAAEAGRLSRGRELEERAVILSIEQARVGRTARELHAVRDEVERVAAALMGAEPVALPLAEEPTQLALPAQAA
jgi:chromosome segregation protein